MKLRMSALLLAFLLQPMVSFAVEPLGPIVESTEVKPAPQDTASNGSQPADPTPESPLAPMTAAPLALATPTTVLDWEDEQGTNLSLSDDTYVKIPIGFTFNFYGVNYTELFVGSNGYLTFGQGDPAYHNVAIPNPVRLPRIVAAYTDWYPVPGSTSNVFANLVGEAPNRRLVVTWWQLRGYGTLPPGPNSFQIQLFENSSKVEFAYKDIYTPFGRSVVVGLDSAAGQYIASADMAAFPSLLGTNICYTPTANGYQEQRQACSRDMTPPQISLPTNVTAEATSSAGAAVTFNATATDDIDPAPVVTCDHATGAVFPIGATVVSCSARDASGNSVSGNFTVSVRDTTPPTITCPRTVAVPVNAPLSDPALISFAGGASAIDTVDTSVEITNSTIPLDGVGNKQVVFTATDDFGNRATCSSIVTVNYRYTGFYSPIDLPPVVNSVKAGSTVPVKWSLPNGAGGYFSDLSSGTLSVKPSVCGSLESELPAEELTTAGSSGLHYDFLANQYVYNWKTAKAQAGGCFLLTLTLNDPSRSTISSLFKLK